MVLIWNGIEFNEVSESEAEKLVKEDKAQFAEGAQGTDLKYRSEFTGFRKIKKKKKKSSYTTKESRPENDKDIEPSTEE